MNFADLNEIQADIAELVRPPRRISVSECAKTAMRIEVPGGYAGPWDSDLTPYMIEPMDLLKSRQHEAVVFVSPARTGKTQALIDGWITHSIVADPGDFGSFFSTQTLTHDYRKRRLERLHRNSKEISARLSKRAHDTTIEMVVYRHGMILSLGWPSSAQMAQRDLRYVALSDYDSFKDDIAGEGSPFELARKRVQNAMSAGMALAESSPKREITQKNYELDGPHAAPPVNGGILQLFNRGDRRRWYWRCLDGCREVFIAPALPNFDEKESVSESAETAHVACPHCGVVYRNEDKRRLNMMAAVDPDAGWLRERNKKGAQRESSIASFWLLGCASAFQQWGSIVENYLHAKREADISGDETAIKSAVNLDQGMPYMPRRFDNVQALGDLEERQEDMTHGVIPDGVRTLLAAVDVQARRFEVAVWGFGEARERWLLDRFAIHQSADGFDLRPAVYLEHWEILIDRVLKKTYDLPDGRIMRMHATAIDLGGYHDRVKAGADSSRRAYDWWRTLRNRSLASQARLVKGEPRPSAPMVAESYPDTSKRKDRKSSSKGDVPVLMINTRIIKDGMYDDLRRDVPGAGYIHLPSWIDSRYIAELNAEEQDEKGNWKKLAGRRNETWDLLCYATALWSFIRGDRIDWTSPPSWAEDWRRNSNVFGEESEIDWEGKNISKRFKVFGRK